MSDRTLDIPEAVVARARTGDDAALHRLVEDVGRIVRRWALVQTGNAADADEVTQEVLIRMIRYRDALPEPARLSGWLYTVTRNAAADHFRKGTRGRELTDSADTLEAAASDVPDPAREAARGELGGLLNASFKGLPRRQREVFELVELQGVPAVEAAEILGIRATSVRGNLFKARRNLRRRILAAWPDIGEDWQ